MTYGTVLQEVAVEFKPQKLNACQPGQATVREGWEGAGREGAGVGGSRRIS